jgi:CHAD domain-containing protein
MAEELELRGLTEAASVRRARLKGLYGRFVGDPSLVRLFRALDQWPETFRESDSGKESSLLERQVSKALSKQIDMLHFALEDVQFDRHELRILVKRTRYLTEAFPSLSPLSKKAAISLKSVQSALGSWHDHFQWCLKAKTEPDLRPLVHVWEQAAVGELEQAEQELKKLQCHLPVIGDKRRRLEASAC